MTSCPLYRADRTIQKPHSALNRSFTASGSEFVGRPALILLGGSARTFGNMTRPSMAVPASTPAVNDPQATQRSAPTERNVNARRFVPVSAGAATPALFGLGRTVAGLV